RPADIGSVPAFPLTAKNVDEACHATGDERRTRCYDEKTAVNWPLELSVATSSVTRQESYVAWLRKQPICHPFPARPRVGDVPSPSLGPHHPSPWPRTRLPCRVYRYKCEQKSQR